MEVFFEDCLKLLTQLHRQAEAALAGLPAEALDWSPAGDANSLAVLVVHMAASERYWIGDVIAGEPTGRDRPAEFAVQGLPPEELIWRLQISLDYCRAGLERMDLGMLAEIRTAPSDGRQVRVGWALGHVIEHTALHVGHIQITRQAWEQFGRGASPAPA